MDIFLIQELLNKNIAHFKQIQKKQKIPIAYHAQINKVTGEILFKEKPMPLAQQREWKLIRIRLFQGKFEVLEEESEIAFQVRDLNPLACKVLIESIKAFTLERSDLVRDAWHSIDRLAAESLLEDQDVGTFLFRKDTYASILEKELSFEFKAPVKCMTLSYVQEKHRVVDLTIVHKDNKWLFFDGDPKLRVPSFSTLAQLLESISENLLSPYLAA